MTDAERNSGRLGAPPVEFLSVDGRVGGAAEQVVAILPRPRHRARRWFVALAVLVLIGGAGWRLAADRGPAQPTRHHVAAAKRSPAPVLYPPIATVNPLMQAERANCVNDVYAAMAVLTRTYQGAKRDGLGERRSRAMAEASFARTIAGGQSEPWYGSVVAIWLTDLSPRFDGTRPVDAYCGD